MDFSTYVQANMETPGNQETSNLLFFDGHARMKAVCFERVKNDSVFEVYNFNVQVKSFHFCTIIKYNFKFNCQNLKFVNKLYYSKTYKNERDCCSTKENYNCQ